MSTSKNLLPFVSSLQPDIIINEDTEVATIFCLSELDRQKGGGIFKKQNPERVVFVSKAYYPLWIVPFQGLTLLFDGLNLSSHTVIRPVFHDSQVFMDSLNQCCPSRQIYTNFLSNNVNYFEAMNTEQNRIVDGLISDLSFLEEFLQFANEAVVTDKPVEGVLISPAQDKTQIVESVTYLENLRLELEHELEQLNQIIKSLNQQTQQTLAGLRQEINAARQKFYPQIEETKVSVEFKRSKTNKEYSNEVTEVSEKFEQELITLRKEIISLQKTNEQTNAEIANAETEIKNATINKDEEAEKKWKEKRNELKKQLPETAATIKNLEAEAQETEERKKKALFQLSQENDALLKEAGSDLIELESSRDAEIKICQNEMEKIENYTSIIIGKIDHLTKINEEKIAEFAKLGIRRETANSSLVYMPFYLIGYQTGPNKRYSSVGPSIANNSSLSARIRAFGKRRITQFFQPRSQKLISKLNAFLRLLDENIAFSHEINDACNRASLLASIDKVDLIRNGLAQLKTQGWLSDAEFESFNKSLL